MNTTKLRKAASFIISTTDGRVADDILKLLIEAADEIDSLRNKKVCRHWDPDEEECTD